ncbi:MAG: Fic/DOC family N-terminal domain-containing protein [Chitinispirillia bacterium]
MKPYIPEQLPLQNPDYKMLFGLVGESNAALARYDGLLQGIVNPVLLLSLVTMQEAVLSSKIEGTQATLDEVLEHEAGVKFEEAKVQDVQEIVNCRQALMAAFDYLKGHERPVTLHLIREMHKILLNSVRGHDKTPGQFRKDQNWIGAAGTPIDKATFVPPSPMQLDNFLHDWQEYVKSDDSDILLQLACVHAQFELIHPFNDGNGRIGRLLIPLFLYQKKKISSPMFYLSSYLEENRDEYYHCLGNISRKKDWNSWILFFFKAVQIQANRNSETVRNVMKLYEEMKIKIAGITHSQYAIHLLDALFDRPIFKTTELIDRTKIPRPTGMVLIRQLKEDGTLLTSIREASGRNPAILGFYPLINIVEGISRVK